MKSMKAKAAVKEEKPKKKLHGAAAIVHACKLETSEEDEEDTKRHPALKRPAGAGDAKEELEDLGADRSGQARDKNTRRFAFLSHSRANTQATPQALRVIRKAVPKQKLLCIWHP